MLRAFACFLLGFALVAPAASAETFQCEFTEPFFTLTYSTKTQRLVKKSELSRTKVTKGVRFQIAGPGSFVLKGRKGQVLLTLELTNKGSAGMGATVFPYAAKLADAGGANGGVGGCASSLLPKKEAN